MRARWNEVIIAESDQTIVIEGNHYFPPDSINTAVLEPSHTTTTCAWKGTAHYYSVIDGADRNVDAAWYYPEPLPAASEIAGYLGFWRGVVVEDSDPASS